VEGVISDLWTVLHLAWRLWTFVWTGVNWWFMFLRLVLFALILLPGFAQMVAFYFFSPRTLRSVCYGTKPRNRLDVYLPRRRYRTAGPCPVLIYVTGGAWTIGYKAWGALFGRRLSQRGVLVFCIDYRNFPQGTALDMTQDINTGIKFVLDNAHLYGGDPGDCVLVGQSAGGHLTALSLLAQAQQKAATVEDVGDAAAAAASVLGGAPAWDPSRFKFYVAVSGAYNLLTLADYLNARGLYRRMFESMMSGANGRPMLAELSPTSAAGPTAPR
jgi:prenylcysteine alpha-carboxyl methylesterase